MKNLISALAVAAVLSSCGSQGSQQDSGTSAAGSGQSQAVQQPVVRNFDFQLINTNPESLGRCGDRYELAISRISDAEVINPTFKVMADGAEVAVLPQGATSYTLDTKDMRCGRITVTVVVSADGIQDEYLSKSIMLLSDIEPGIKQYKVLKTYNHDRGAYTQGLLVEDGVFYESTGLQQKSSLRKVGIEKGDIIQSVPLEDELFGEGLASTGDKLYQLTWRNHKAFAYDKKTFARLQEFYLPTEGWGLSALSADTLLMTDGTENLYFVDASSFAILKTVQVCDRMAPVLYLNETEIYKGHLLANVYQSDQILEIDYNTGKVINYIDMANLLPDNLRDAHTDVLNGIAYDEQRDALYVTGKNWPKIYLIKIQ